MRNMDKEHHALQSHFLIISCFFRQICCYPSCNALQDAFKVLFQSKKSRLDIQTLTSLYLGGSALCRPNSALSYPSHGQIILTDPEIDRAIRTCSIAASPSAPSSLFRHLLTRKRVSPKSETRPWSLRQILHRPVNAVGGLGGTHWSGLASRLG